jgi:hypothetical protein
MKEIEVGQGKQAIVDDDDYPYLSRFHWIYSKKNGAVRGFQMERGQNTYAISMWKFVIASENNKEVLYKNRNHLDLRKENLFLVPEYIARHYSQKKKTGSYGKPSSKYKGVYFSRENGRAKKWIWNIQKNKVAFRGYCHTERAAVKAYNKKARELYGEFAYQNKV